MEDIRNGERHGDVPEWGLEDLTDSVLYDVFYESTTMLAGRMLAQQRLAAGQGNRYREHWARMNRYGLLSDRDRVDPTDREALVRTKRMNDSNRMGRALMAEPWHEIGRQSAVDVDRIWNEDILPTIEGVAGSDDPCTVFVGGQPGAGKTRAVHMILDMGLHEGTLLPVNGDDLRQYHPDYDRLCDEDPLGMPLRTAEASAEWIRRTMAYATANRVSTIVEGTWRNASTVLDEASNAKRNGRTTHAIVLAVPPVLSRIAILERYYRDRSVGLPSRWTPTSAHENTVRNLASTVRLIAGSPLIDQFTVIDRNGVVLFDGTGDGGKDGWHEWMHKVSRVSGIDGDAQLARVDFLERAWSAFTPDNGDARMLLNKIHCGFHPRIPQ
ncbi:zeta toxin family protein [Bifidobacterium moukalabense]|uniref:zeta toxin family protein n=1 Tax=Bifidobacterium moukalabense TaxID=1333651 RepID=UPI0010F5CEB2|nr:zeta toxin family protein [Bifidobacterium moukalabense]